MYLFFDTETTGLPINSYLPHTAIENWPRLVSIAWILCDENRKILENEKFIIKPDEFEIPESASIIHGITTERAIAEGKPIQEVLSKFLDAIQNAKCVVGYNVRFDRKVVAAELYRYMHHIPERIDNFFYEFPYLDTMHVACEYVRISNKNNSGFKFPTLNETYSKIYDKELENAHDAYSDVKATLVCFWKLYDLGLVDKFYKTHKCISFIS